MEPREQAGWGGLTPGGSVAIMFSRQEMGSSSGAGHFPQLKKRRAGEQKAAAADPVESVLPDVRIPEQEERRLPKQCNSQKKGSLLLTRIRAPAVRPTQWYGVREPRAEGVIQIYKVCISG